MRSTSATTAVTIVTVLLALAAANAAEPARKEAAMNAPAHVQPTAESNKALVARVGDAVFNRHDFSALEAVKPDYIQHNPLVPQGREGFRSFFADTFKAVPDWRHEAKKVVAEGDLVTVYGTYRSTQSGEWLGIPATNKAFAIDAVDIFRVEGGQLAEHWDVMDIYGLFKQLGVIP